MEAAQTFHRYLLRALAQSSRCQHARTTTAKKIKPPQHTSPLPIINISSRRPFTSSTLRRRDVATEPEPGNNPIESTPATPASPLEARRLLESYVSSMQKIITTHKLRERLPGREYERLMISVTDADVRLGAPNQAPESFAPQLASLKSQVEPVLTKLFDTSDVEVLAAKAPEPVPPKPTPAAASSLLDAAMGTSPRPPQRPSPAQTRASIDDQYSQLENILSTLGPLPTPSRNQSIAHSLAQSLSSPLSPTFAALAARPVLRLKPTLGRTVDVQASFDVARAFRALDGHCARNKVRADERAQRYHVRRGQRKKDLRISRWRKMFREGFVAETRRVRRMWKQGW